MASTNADSMSNEQGEFRPSAPRSEPLTTKGHQIGQQVSEADNAPEFHAETLPPGTAPADRTFQPNPTSEIPGQADNEDVLRSHGKESTYTDAETTLGGTDSAAVNTGLGHPGSGETSHELRHDGKHTRKRERQGVFGRAAPGGSGLYDEGNAEARDLQSDHTGTGPTTEHYISQDGAEAQEPVTSEQLAAERS